MISAGDLSGFEFGPGSLNPYEQFKSLTPKAVIDYGVFVYEGHFAIPLAASLGHSQKAQAFSLPTIAGSSCGSRGGVCTCTKLGKTNAMLGEIHAAAGEKEKARAYYEKALLLAKTVEPEFQAWRVEDLEKKLNQR